MRQIYDGTSRIVQMVVIICLMIVHLDDFDITDISTSGFDGNTTNIGDTTKFFF